MSDVGPEQVERGHLDGDQKHRVDCFLDGCTHTTDLEDAVLGYDFHGNIGLSAVGKKVEKCSQVDEYAEEEVDHARATVEDDPQETEDSIKEESYISFGEAPDLLHDGSESAHVVLYEGLYGRDGEDVG